ncbi:hypothetical protein HDV05_002258 [Chytridiales sp. JEL 0842]|nr:hypothetical protein HDV05_002258 [Chytridiales sp. JEL 0842]
MTSSVSTLGYRSLTKSIFHGLRNSPQAASSTTLAHRPKPSPTRSPVVLLCGWMGGALRHVSKYAQYYQDNGYDVIVALCTHEDTFSFKTASRNLKPLIPLLEEYKVLTSSPGDSRVIVHVFSNGGCYMLNTLNMMLNNGTIPETPPTPFQPKEEQEESKALLKGDDMGTYQTLRTSAVILDSCPGKFHRIHNNVRAFSTFVSTPWIRTYLWKPVLYILFAILMTLQRFRRRPPAVAIAAKNAVSTLHPLPGPRLFLYSKADELVHWEDTKEWVDEARREKGGMLVREKVWEDAEHVGIARRYRDEYWNEVSKFLEECR